MSSDFVDCVKTEFRAIFSNPSWVINIACAKRILYFGRLIISEQLFFKLGTFGNEEGLFLLELFRNEITYLP